MTPLLLTLIIGCLAFTNFVYSIDIFDKFSKCPKPPLDVCPNNDITFHLFNGQVQAYDGYLLKENNLATIQNAPFIKNKKVIISCHGYTSNIHLPPTPELIDAYKQKKEDVNIIGINWNPLCRSPCYIQAVRNLVLVGKCTAAFIELLLKHQSWLTLKDIHYVGFSLGAQAGSQVARHLTIGKLPRLTALDAAFPLFDPMSKKKVKRLDKDDAEFVDVYHSNAGQKGMPMNIGHVDFYANRALIQPGCGKDSVCNHKRAVLYFAESIHSKVGFYSYKCPNILAQLAKTCKPEPGEELVLLGQNVDQNLRGTYFFTTNSQPPFAKGKVYDETK